MDFAQLFKSLDDLVLIEKKYGMNKTGLGTMQIYLTDTL